MPVHIDEVTTQVEVAPTTPSAASAPALGQIVVALSEAARRRAEEAARRALRTRAEGFDD